MPLRDLTNDSNAGQQQQQLSSNSNNKATPATAVEDGPKITIVSIEAAIGTGKSSLLRMLHKRVHDMKHLTPESLQSNNKNKNTTSTQQHQHHGAEWRWVFVQEPVEMWQDVRKFHSDPDYQGEDNNNNDANGPRHDDSEPPSSTAAGEETIDNTLPSTEEFNLLGKFYKDPPAFAFKLQSWAMLSRIETVCRTIEEIKEEYRGPDGDKRPVLVVLERSWTSDRNTFSMMHRDSGCMRPYEWVMYDQMFNFASRNAPIIDGHIYLQCTASTCMHRLKKRDRHEESGVSAEYQTALIQRHEDWLATVDGERLCRINVDDEFISNTKRADMIFGELCSFADKLFSKKTVAVGSSTTTASTSSVEQKLANAMKNNQEQSVQHQTASV